MCAVAEEKMARATKRVVSECMLMWLMYFMFSGLLKCCVCVSWVSGVERGGVWVSGFDLMTQIGSSQANIYWEGCCYTE